MLFSSLCEGMCAKPHSKVQAFHPQQRISHLANNNKRRKMYALLAAVAVAKSNFSEYAHDLWPPLQ
jgi:hypothetical protein